MSTTAVPSKLPEDFALNIENLDKFSNGTELTFTDRLGNVKPSIAGLSAEYPNASVNAAAAAADALASEASRLASGVYAGLADMAKVEAEVARDAALVNAGKKTSLAAGLADAAILADQYFLVPGSGNSAASEYQKKASVNLFNTATVRDGFLLNSGSGVVNSLAGWGISAFIPVVVGQQYTISGTRGRYGVSFFTSASDAAVVAGSYNGTTTLPLTVTAPATATHMVIGLYSATAGTYSNVQVEPGAVVTTYAAFGGYFGLPIVDYPSTPYVAGIAASAATLQASKDLIDAQVLSYAASKNLYNAANKLSGKYVQSGDGAIVNDAAWGTSGFIPVTPGQSYTISAGASKRSGLAFFTTNNSTAGTLAISGSFNGTGTLPLTVTAPAGAAYMLVNIKSNSIAEPASIQIEAGTSATAYEAWHVPYPQVKKSAITPLVNEVSNLNAYAVFSLDTVTPANNYVEAVQSGRTLSHMFTPFTGVTHSVSNVFNFLSSTLDGVVFHTPSDDAAPYRVFGTTLGASHGYFQTYCEVDPEFGTVV